MEISHEAKILIERLRGILNSGGSSYSWKMQKIDTIYQELKEKITPMVPDSSEMCIDIKGSVRTIVKCCDHMGTCIDRGAISVYHDEPRLKIKLLDMYLLIDYCPFCGIKTNVR